ncbi:MAG: glycosyltransferase family 2 protein [Candidatus Marinimicrobia bacterium]|nr:glycosyltransferase family 2 protein [Candidatus Neomarinimicrobiota bacterium]
MKDLSPTPSVSIIAPIFNGGVHYPACFRSLCNLAYPPERLEVHIVNDGSLDGTREFLEAQDPPEFMHIHHLPQNGGLGAARNHGLEQAAGEVVILLDGDMEVATDFVAAHVAELAKPGREAVVGRIEPAHWVPRSKLNRYLYDYRRRGARQFGKHQPVGFQYLLSSNTAFSRAAIEAAGGRYEPFTHYGGEETTFAYNVARKFPNGIFYSEKPLARHQANDSLSAFLGKMREYGYHNLPQIISRHPEIATPLAADFAWPLPGAYFRRRRRLGRLLFNTATSALARAGLALAPPTLGNALVRFLTVGSVVRGLRRYVRENFPDASNTPATANDRQRPGPA